MPTDPRTDMPAPMDHGRCLAAISARGGKPATLPGYHLPDIRRDIGDPTRWFAAVAEGRLPAFPLRKPG
jgi:hypothetical protein